MQNGLIIFNITMPMANSILVVRRSEDQILLAASIENNYPFFFALSGTTENPFFFHLVRSRDAHPWGTWYGTLEWFFTKQCRRWKKKKKAQPCLKPWPLGYLSGALPLCYSCGPDMAKLFNSLRKSYFWRFLYLFYSWLEKAVLIGKIRCFLVI